MPDSENSPQAARRLREFGRRRVPGDPESDPAETTSDPAASRPHPTMKPGSLFGPESYQPPPAPTPEPEPEPAPAPPPPPQSQVDPEPNHTDPTAAGQRSTRRKERRAAAETEQSVRIDADEGHAWWAMRDDLNQVVNPKKRGAAARAQRAAREAFAPAGTTNISAEARAAEKARWDPSQVYTWTTPEADASSKAPPPPPPAHTPTPWDVLGLTSDASWDDVARRHKHLAKQHHPDRHALDDVHARTHAETLMAEINAAVSDLRRIYRLTEGM